MAIVQDFHAHNHTMGPTVNNVQTPNVLLLHVYVRENAKFRFHF